jgi:hypothetical protein
MTLTDITGSSSCGLALRKSSLNAIDAQVLNARSLESTSW